MRELGSTRARTLGNEHVLGRRSVRLRIQAERNQKRKIQRAAVDAALLVTAELTATVNDEMRVTVLCRRSGI